MIYFRNALSFIVLASASLMGGADAQCVTSPCCAETATCPIGGTEGPIQSLEPETSVHGGVRVSVMRVTVILAASSFTAGTITSGPGIALTVNDILDPETGVLSAALPGRDQPSFIDGTLKCEVADIDEDGQLTGIVGAMVGRVCIIEAAENVLLARVSEKIEIDEANTANDVCLLKVGDEGGGVLVVPNSDARYAYRGTIDPEGMVYGSP